MPTYLFIILHLCYLLFLIFLINTYVRDVGKKNIEIINTNSSDIFIPENSTYNELYMQQLNDLYLDSKKNNDTFKFKFINILPYSDILTSKNGLWNLLEKNIIPIF